MTLNVIALKVLQNTRVEYQDQLQKINELKLELESAKLKLEQIKLEIAVLNVHTKLSAEEEDIPKLEEVIPKTHTPIAIKLRPSERDVLRTLINHGEAASNQEVADTLNKTYAAVATAMSRLQNRKLVTKHYPADETGIPGRVPWLFTPTQAGIEQFRRN